MSSRFHFNTAVAHADLDSIIEVMDNIDPVYTDPVYTREELVNMKMIFGGGLETTALIFSVKQDMPDIVQYLLTVGGIDVNLIDTTGRSALHWAAGIRNEDIVKLLVKMPGIQLEIEDMSGDSAQDLADSRISCIIQAAIIANLKKKVQENVNIEDTVKEMPRYGKRKLNLTLEIFESKKKKHSKEVEKLSKAIDKAKECIKNADPVATLQDAKKDFDCPICFEEMKPPMEIWQCDAGHTLCGNCKYGSLNIFIKKCPTCSKDIRGRNRAMENLYPALF